MRPKHVCRLLVVIAGLLIYASPGWAKESCYNYLIAYSFRDKAVYYTPIFIRENQGVSYNAEEYVSDTASQMKMESAFEKHLTQKKMVRSVDLTVSARVAFKTQDIAKSRMDKEVGDFRFRGFNLKEVSDFKFD